MRFFVTAAKGTEPALRDELRELRLRHVRADRGGVHFEGELVDAARACLWSRVGIRVLQEVTAFEARDSASLYAGVRTVDWTRWLTPRSTLALRASCRSSGLTHSQFVAQRSKDAIVDALRDRFNARPSVDKRDPDVLVAVHLVRDRATLYLDVGGGSLHERGWRERAGEAPLRETLAAALVRLSGWDRSTPLVDPMCGAGTIAIEAAAWSMRMAPGLARARFGFERWADCDQALRQQIQRLRNDARDAKLGEGPWVGASDIDARAVEFARHNAHAANVAVAVERRAVRDLMPLRPPGFVVSNPPYGERVEADRALYDDLARALRAMHGHTVALLAGNPAIGRSMRIDPERSWTVYNGPLECRLLVYEIR